MSFQYTGPMGKVVLGRDFNFFQKLTFSSVDFPNECNVIITFPTTTVTFHLESGGPIEYSFNRQSFSSEIWQLQEQVLL